MSSLKQELETLSQAYGIASVNSKEFADVMDANDPLSSVRNEFHIPYAADIKQTALNPDFITNAPIPDDKTECVYLVGNSLGLQAKKAQQNVDQEFEKWKRVGVMGHTTGERPWLTIDDESTALMAKIVGAKTSEVALMNSLTANLHILMVPFYRPTADRFKILIEAGSFPSDLFTAESQAFLHDFDPKDAVVQISPREGEYILRTEDIISTINSHKFAVIMLPGIQFSTGQYLEMQKITEAGHSSGAIVGFDLAHAAGNVELKLHDWNVDFAAWCSYKYLNSGPGGIGGLFVHEKHHQNQSLKKFSGWWGHDLKTRFDMKDCFVPIPGAYSFRLSNPSVFPMVSLLATLEIMDRVGIESLKKKSRLLTGYLEYLIDTELSGKVVITTPRNPDHRGCQLSLLLEREAKKTEHDLFLKGIVCDARHKIIRAAPTPLYNTFKDVRRFIDALKEVLSAEGF